MAANKVLYASASAATETGKIGRTNAIWKNFPVEQVREDPSNGDFLWDNFLSIVGPAIAANRGAYASIGSTWTSFESTGCSIKVSNADNPATIGGQGVGYGVLKILAAGLAHVSVAMELGGTANGAGAGAFGVGSNGAITLPGQGSFPRLFFETRVRIPQAAGQSMFFGLAVPGQTASANTIFGVGDAYVNQNSIGFQINGAASQTVINGLYGVAASAPVVVGTGTAPATVTNFTKLGFVVDPFDQNGQIIKFYQDGVVLGAQTLAQMTAAKWPSNVPLNPVFYVQQQGAGATAVELDVDWLAIGTLLNIE